MKKLHDARRAAGICIQNPKHGPAFRGGRCKECWKKKLAAERAKYRQRGSVVFGLEVAIVVLCGALLWWAVAFAPDLATAIMVTVYIPFVIVVLFSDLWRRRRERAQAVPLPLALARKRRSTLR